MALKARQRSFYRLCMIPGLAVIIPLFGYLFTQTIWMSMHEYDFQLQTQWVSLEHYRDVILDWKFWRAASNSIIYVAGVVLANLVIGFAMALLAWKKRKGGDIVKLLWTMPMLFIPASTALLWIFVYSRDFGLIPEVLVFFGFERVNLLAKPSTVLLSVMITDIWGWTPWLFLILYAGLESLPLDPFEAAALDGVNWWQRFWYITLPLMRPVIIIAVFLKTVDTFKAFTYLWIMTRGGPGGVADIFSTFIYKIAFEGFEYGRAAVVCILQLIVLCPFIVLYIRVIRR